MKQMMKKALSLSMVGLLALCLTVSSVGAGPYVATAKLEQTPAGYDCLAEGMTRVSKTMMEKFAVKVSAALKDGTVLIVSATAKNGKTFDVGAISLSLGSGSLELNSLEDEASPAFPVQELAGVTVSLEGEALLQGKFQTTLRISLEKNAGEDDRAKFGH